LPWPFKRIQSIPVTSQALKRELTPKYYGYAPSLVDCPSPKPTIRNSSSVSPQETDWLEKRRKVTGWAIRNFLARVNISGFDLDAYMNKIAGSATALPTIAIAVSGGGWRAHMNGAGGVAAFDNRTVNSTSPGQLGGLLQAATYLTGLSGGAWLVGSLYVPKLRSVQELYTMDPNTSTSLWQFDNSIIEGVSDKRFSNT
jgi:lysophospholipase